MERPATPPPAESLGSRDHCRRQGRRRSGPTRTSGAPLCSVVCSPWVPPKEDAVQVRADRFGLRVERRADGVRGDP